MKIENPKFTCQNTTSINRYLIKLSALESSSLYEDKKVLNLKIKREWGAL
jgi:hypothetical protein